MEETTKLTAAQERFGTELEFVSALANPFYLSTLAQSGYFDRPEFVRYLSALRTNWQQPHLARYVQFPQALAMLDLLQSAAFRESLKHQDTASELARLQVAHAATWRMPPRKQDEALAEESLPAA